MNLNKSIEIQTKYLKDHYAEMSAQEWDAHQMGIEALKRILYTREHYSLTPVGPLPGETEED